METINNIISHSLNIGKYFNNEKVCFLDIETTGLSRSKNMVYLIGILYHDHSTWTLKQYFANALEKEKDLLLQFVSDISDFDKIITYNGDSFDLPFIDHRLKHHSIDYNIYEIKSFDIYRVIKYNKIFLNLKNLKLKTIESSLGFHREDIYSGLDCIGFYYNELLKDNILKHNYDDLVHMLDIMIILDIIDNKKSLYIQINNKSTKFSIEDISISGDMIIIVGIVDNLLDKNIKHFDKVYSIVTEDLYKFIISIEYKQGYVSKDKKAMYIDLLDIPIVSGITDLTEYNLPSNILTLLIEKKYSLENIKNLLKEILINILI